MDLPIYETLEVSLAIMPAAEVIVLTSPSNARAMSNASDWPGEARFVAIGPTTAKALKDLGVSDLLIAWEASEKALGDQIVAALPPF